MKKLISIILAGLMVLSLAACAGKKDAESDAPESGAPESTEPDTKEDETKDTEPSGDGQNPVMNFIGDYVADRATITIQPLGKTDAQIHITWSDSAFAHSEWDMTGTFDTDDLTIEYEDCVKKTIVFKENGEIESETIDYEDGVGEIAFLEGGKLVWDDDEEDIAEGVEFEFLSPAGRDDETEADTPEDPVELVAGIYESDRVTAEITTTEKPGKAKILIHWASSAYEVTTWEMTGVLDESRGVIDYGGCTKTNITFGEDGSEKSSEVVYEDGNGKLTFFDRTMTWEDEKEDAGKDLSFVLVAEDPVLLVEGAYSAGRASAYVTPSGEPGRANILIHWASSAYEVTTWEMTGVLDKGKGVIEYDECIKTNITFGEDGTETASEEVYSDGTGRLTFFDRTMTWEDDKEDAGKDLSFELTGEEIEPDDSEGSVGGQNPVMNFIGNYVADRAVMYVQCWGDDSARITISWSSSASENTEWCMIGPLDTDTLTVTYDECVKKNVTYGDDGTIKDEEFVYTDGTGTIKFNEDGTAVWVEDQADPQREVTFEYITF
ncbi:MAG: hypothetical protein IJM62_03750 [Lachnospiraceae bacterium]|nr:hypothetical protein [Lachnospiraceae bacterium]